MVEYFYRKTIDTYVEIRKEFEEGIKNDNY